MDMREHIQHRCDLALTYAEDGAYISAARILRELAAEVKEHADEVCADIIEKVGDQFPPDHEPLVAKVTPFHDAYPTPWRLADREVVDCNGCNIQDFDDDPDTIEFWRGIVDAVNAIAADPINLAGSGPVPIGPREG